MRVFVRKEDYTPEASWGLLEWCLAHGADEFSLAFLSPAVPPASAVAEADEALDPFRLPE